jgi:hypothetical protein
MRVHFIFITFFDTYFQEIEFITGGIFIQFDNVIWVKP